MTMWMPGRNLLQDPPHGSYEGSRQASPTRETNWDLLAIIALAGLILAVMIFCLSGPRVTGQVVGSLSPAIEAFPAGSSPPARHFP
jgi:hypothetical protein